MSRRQFKLFGHAFAIGIHQNAVPLAHQAHRRHVERGSPSLIDHLDAYTPIRAVAAGIQLAQLFCDPRQRQAIGDTMVQFADDWHGLTPTPADKYKPARSFSEASLVAANTVDACPRRCRSARDGLAKPA
ncbi:hypothetical protein C7E19_22245 [Stenotrophomonas maltophilia]|nr:hypothetical protein C7E19_22245 [Stenotrophomonas maltophilia]